MMFIKTSQKNIKFVKSQTKNLEKMDLKVRHTFYE